MSGDGGPQPRLSIVVPVLNEGATMYELVERTEQAVRSIVADFEIIIVDDGSGRAELDVLHQVADRFDSVRAIELEWRRGQIAALVRGLTEARGELVVTLDGDLQDPPEEIPRLVAHLGASTGVVTATRATQPGPMWRTIGSRTASRWAGLLVGVRLSDYGGQFNAYHRQALDDILSTWRPSTPLLPLACALGIEVREIPVRRDPRSIGRSRYGLCSLLRVLTDLTVNFAPPRVLVGLATVSAFCTVASMRLVRRAVRLGSRARQNKERSPPRPRRGPSWAAVRRTRQATRQAPPP